MTDDVFDIRAARLRRSREKQASRPAEFGLDIWLENGQVDTVSIHGDEKHAPRGPVSLAILIEAAFLYAYKMEGCDPVLWIICDANGHTSYLLPPNLFNVGGWRRGWWMLGRWWQVTRRMWGYAWRMARGPRA